MTTPYSFDNFIVLLDPHTKFNIMDADAHPEARNNNTEKSVFYYISK